MLQSEDISIDSSYYVNDKCELRFTGGDRFFWAGGEITGSVILNFNVNWETHGKRSIPL